MIAPGARALVTGGAGFIGPHLVHRLFDEECSVVILDNFVTGRRAHLDAHRGHGGVTVVECDLRDRDQTIAVVTDVRPDVVVHLAAHQVIAFCVANPAEALRVNVLGTQHLLDAVARTDSCQRFLLASTGGVYAPSERPHTEADPLAASDVYAASKRLSEELVAFAANQCPTVRFLVARFFNVYGPGETSAHLIPEILEALAGGKRLRLGNLESRRDYVYVTDVVDALIRLGQYPGSRSVFNVGTGQGWSAMDIVHRLEIILKRRIDVEVDPVRVRRTDRPSLVADPTLAREDLGWTAKIALDEGLRRMLAMTNIRAPG
jgi:UDP-glucose 4-epimerase